VTGLERSRGTWTINFEQEGESKTILAKQIINCAGNYSDDIHKMLISKTEKDCPEQKPFSITPGRGEYVIFRKKSCSSLDVKQMVLPVPSDVSVGVIVYESFDGRHLVCGPTHKVQTSKTDRENDREELAKLENHAKELFPSILQDLEPVGSFCGLRPRCKEVILNHCFLEFPLLSEQRLPNFVRRRLCHLRRHSIDRIDGVQSNRRSRRGKHIEDEGRTRRRSNHASSFFY